MKRARSPARQARRAARFEIANARHAVPRRDRGPTARTPGASCCGRCRRASSSASASNVTLKTDVRLIAATNRKLDDDVRAGRFRQDLWFRLNVFPITVPPLRQRVEDIPLLLNHFIEKHCRNMGKPVLQVSKATMKELQSRDWPGNIRELENVVERAVIPSRGSMFEVSDWIPDLHSARGSRNAERHPDAGDGLGADRPHAGTARARAHRVDTRTAALACRRRGRGGSCPRAQREHTARPHAQAQHPAAGEPAAGIVGVTRFRPAILALPSSTLRTCMSADVVHFIMIN